MKKTLIVVVLAAVVGCGGLFVNATKTEKAQFIIGQIEAALILAEGEFLRWTEHETPPDTFLKIRGSFNTASSVALHQLELFESLGAFDDSPEIGIAIENVRARAQFAASFDGFATAAEAYEAYQAMRREMEAQGVLDVPNVDL